MPGNEPKYIPPLVSGNRFKEYLDYHKTLNKSNLDVGGYVRISTAKDSQTTSVENQKKYITAWAEANKYNIVHFYIDVKSGAYTYLRNEMKQLLEDVNNGKIKGIISKEISRTSRDIIDVLEIKRSLADKGAFFISIKEGYDSRTDDDEFLLIIHAGLAQKERKTTSSRVRITQLIKAKEGKTNVPSPAFGYKLSDDRQHLVIDPDKAKIYREIAGRFLDGWGQLKLVKWLNRESIPTKRGKKWSTNSVKTILTNPVYLGITIFNSTTLVRDSQGKQKRVVRPFEEWVIRENTHEPLISKEEFDRIQEIIKERREKDSKEWSCEKKYLLSGYLFCDTCNGKIYGCKTVNKKRKFRDFNEIYTFYSYVDQNRNGSCDTKSKYWNMKKVDNLVMGEIKKLFEDKALIEQKIKAKWYLYDKSLASEKAEREKFTVRLSMIDNSIRKQQEAYENGIILPEEYKSRMTELREQKNSIKTKLAALDKRLEKAYNSEKVYNNIKDKVFESIENIDRLGRDTKDAILKRIIKRIYLRDDYTFSIVYNFEN